ncbi:MAG: hypothetical protein ACR2PL_22865 [Dehalococcoidia bacterium]
MARRRLPLPAIAAAVLFAMFALAPHHSFASPHGHVFKGGCADSGACITRTHHLSSRHPGASEPPVAPIAPRPPWAPVAPPMPQ